MRIQQIMIKNPVCLSESDTAAEAARLMKLGNIGAVILTKEEKVCGIVTERDMVTRLVAEGKDASTTLLSDIATKNPTTVSQSALISECVMILRDVNFRHLPVTNADGKPVGIVSTRDFYRKLAEGMDRYIEQSEYNRKLAEGEDPYDTILGSYN